MNVMVDVLASNDRSYRVGLLLRDTTVALELSSLLFETGLDSFFITMDEVTLFDGKDVDLMLLGKYLAILDRLN